MSYSFVKNSVNAQTVEETQLVMTYELCRILDCVSRDVSDPAYRVFANSELSDFISMCRMLCEQKSWVFGVTRPKSLRIPCTALLTVVQMQIAFGKLVRGCHYIKRYNDAHGDDPEEAMAVLVSLMHNLCLDMGWWFEETAKLGEERYEERMADLRTRGVNNQLKSEFQRSNECPGKVACDGCAAEGTC